MHRLQTASVALLLIAGVSDVNAQAKNETVQDMYQICTGSDDTERALCTGYVTGIGDYMWLIGVARKDQQLGLCASPSPSHGAMLQAFVVWAQHHPELWNKEAEIGVRAALRETWPCVGTNSR
jgi:hypothetical protein